MTDPIFRTLQIGDTINNDFHKKKKNHKIKHGKTFKTFQLKFFIFIHNNFISN